LSSATIEASSALTPIAVAMFPNAVTPATLLMASPQFSQDMGAATTTFSGNGSNLPKVTAIPSNG
jgi:hypothetical protein